MDAQERSRRATLWEAAADERERAADERDSVADEREWLADERDRLIEQRELELDRLESALAEQGLDVKDQLSAAREAVRRAEPAPGRATEELARVRQAASRTEGRMLRDGAGRDRAVSAGTLLDASDEEERAWLMERRDFVAAERDRMADSREDSAEDRDESAVIREELADKRDRAVSERERHQQGRARGRRAGVLRLSPGASDPTLLASSRADVRARRIRTARERQDAAHARERAAALWGPEQYGPRLIASFAEVASALFAGEDPARCCRKRWTTGPR